MTTEIPAIETHRLSKFYPRGFRRGVTRALHGLDLEVRRGEIFGFIGPNGAGKTTTIKILMGFTSPTEGECRLLGHAASHTAIRRRIGFLPENPYFHQFLNGRQALHFYGSLFGLGSKKIHNEIARLKELLSLSDELTTPLSKHSKGMLQRTGLAQALINDPELLILDEPMFGLDPIGRVELRDTLASLRDTGKTIFFSTHILADVEKLCDRIAILVRGGLARTIEMQAFLSEGRYFQIECSGAPAVTDAFPASAGTDGRLILRLRSPEERDRAVRLVTENGGSVHSVAEKTDSIEDIFVREVRARREGGDAA